MRLHSEGMCMHMTWRAGRNWSSKRNIVMCAMLYVTWNIPSYATAVIFLLRFWESTGWFKSALLWLFHQSCRSRLSHMSYRVQNLFLFRPSLMHPMGFKATSKVDCKFGCPNCRFGYGNLWFQCPFHRFGHYNLWFGCPRHGFWCQLLGFVCPNHKFLSSNRGCGRANLDSGRSKGRTERRDTESSEAEQNFFD